MYSFYKLLLNWSEVWPLAVALTIYIFFKQRENITIIVLLLGISLLLHMLATYISLYTYRVPEPYKNNNILYNLVAIIKPLLAGLYLLKLKQLNQYKYLKIIFIWYHNSHTHTLLCTYLIQRIIVEDENFVTEKKQWWYIKFKTLNR